MRNGWFNGNKTARHNNTFRLDVWEWGGQIGGQSATGPDDKWTVHTVDVNEYMELFKYSSLLNSLFDDSMQCGFVQWMDDIVCWKIKGLNGFDCQPDMDTGFINEAEKNNNNRKKNGCMANMSKSTYKDVYGFRNVLPRYSVRFSRDCGMRTRRWMLRRRRRACRGAKEKRQERSTNQGVFADG